MEELLGRDLLAKTKRALEANEWNAVVGLWQPWIDAGDAEAEYQLAYHYLRCTPRDDDATCDRMEELLRSAAAKGHPDAVWFLATRGEGFRERSSDFDQELLRAGQLGSILAQRALGVMYATGEWSAPKDLAEAARWYRLAAERGEAESQYDLGFMLLLGEGGSKNIEEGMMWLERAAEQGASSAFGLLVDCYSNGFCGVPVNTAKAQLWRHRMEEYERRHPVRPSRRYSVDGTVSQSSLDRLLAIEGVTGFGFLAGDRHLAVFYEREAISPTELDEKIRAAGLSDLPGE